MGQIRALAAADIPAVAGLFQKAFRRTDAAPSDAFVACLRTLYVDHPLVHDSLPSLVHESKAGISGFISRHRLPMQIGGRAVNGALFGTIMADKGAGHSLIGPKLLKAALAGPQDFSFADTTSDISRTLGQRLGCTPLPSHSLNWLRIIRPTQWLADQVTQRFRPFGLLAPVAGAADDMLRRRIHPNRPRWFAHGAQNAAKGAATTDIGAEKFAALFLALSRRFALQPRWDCEDITTLSRQAMEKRLFGTPHFGAVTDQHGTEIGCFLYHLKKGSTARVLQVLAAPGVEGVVLDALITNAADKGAAAVIGRTEAWLMEAMLGRRIGFTNTASSMVHSRDADILAAVTRGDVLLNGFVGEQWSPMIGNRFE
ncbi:hypothetical protein GAO09_16310 [Rhizobiales bacterium RZME27]|uniref:GNAT family N-acetyltransferase n=1 Tax=Endobacterium cereale TaxID=2663029 RepID=A0A6A8AA62_9HYPH|nr:hypothetical protein [Endobacterium cereale]MEB2846983.1 hypothetical protein [Endobacterium cereale]MQY47599.1 hypothetical protein [Endobacterium cereale]